MVIDWRTDELGLGADAARVVEKALVFVAIIIGVWLARRLLDEVLPRLLRPLTGRIPSRFDDRFVAALLPPLRFLITLGGLALAVIALGLPGPINRPLNSLFDSLVAFAVFWTLFRLVDPVGDLVARMYRRASPSPAVPDVLLVKTTQVGKQITRGLITLLGFAAILRAWNLDVNGLIAGFGIAGAAVALATKDTLANLLGYFVILADEPFNEGDYVVIGTVSGTVEHLGFRSTRIRALAQALVTIPNNTIMNANVTNWSRLTKRRLNMTLGIDVTHSPEQVLALVQSIRAMLRAHPAVEPDSVVVQFTDFDAKTLNIMIICFMKIPGWNDFQAARQNINLRIMRLLNEYGIIAPSAPQQVPATPGEAAEAAAAAEVFVPPLPPLKPEPSTSTATNSPMPDDAENDPGSA